MEQREFAREGEERGRKGGGWNRTWGRKGVRVGRWDGGRVGKWQGGRQRNEGYKGGRKGTSELRRGGVGSGTRK